MATFEVDLSISALRTLIVEAVDENEAEELALELFFKGVVEGRIGRCVVDYVGELKD